MEYFDFVCFSADEKIINPSVKNSRGVFIGLDSTFSTKILSAGNILTALEEVKKQANKLEVQTCTSE